MLHAEIKGCLVRIQKKPKSKFLENSRWTTRLYSLFIENEEEIVIGSVIGEAENTSSGDENTKNSSRKAKSKDSKQQTNAEGFSNTGESHEKSTSSDSTTRGVGGKNYSGSNNSGKDKNQKESKSNDNVKEKTKKTKSVLTRKGKSAKKTRLKNKLMSTIYVAQDILTKGIPSSIVTCIRKARLELIKLDTTQQKAIIETVTKFSKEELAIMLLLIPNNENEMIFLKETFMTRQFLDTLFRNINTDLIE